MAKYAKWFVQIFLVITLACLYLAQVGDSRVQASPLSGIIRVASNGTDESGCGAEGSPCKTIQYAVNQASSDDEIRVAAGTYTYDSAHDICTSNLGSTAVVCIVNKKLVIKGGYSTDDWSTADLDANPTIIDGGNTYRGVFVVRTDQTTGLHMENFIIRNGLAKGIPLRGGDDADFGYGGGMFIDLGNEPDPSNPVVLQNLIFRNNKAVGENTNKAYGGSGVGGGLALRAVSSTDLKSLTFEGNEARGGCGTSRGGYGIGGGLHTLRSTVTFSHLTLTNNKAQGGSCPLLGVESGEKADAQGGGAATHGYTLTLVDVTATGNQAIGGDADKYGGRSFGGALYVENGSLAVYDSDLRDNTSLGGNGPSGGLAAGGAIDAHNSDLAMERTKVIDNLAKGGDGTTCSGSPGGGGIYVARLAQDAGNRLVVIKNSVLAGNRIEFGTGDTSVGGGAGAAWLQGAEVTISHTTFAGNQLVGYPLQGQAILLLNVGAATPSNVSMGYSIIADHTSGTSTGAVHAQSGNTISLNRTLWAANHQKISGEGTIHDDAPLNVATAGFVSPGAPNHDYHLLANSPAIDQATNSSESVDVDSEPRPIFEEPDIGADECSLPGLVVSPPNSDEQTLSWRWIADLDYFPRFDCFMVAISCEPGANPPNEAACDESIDVGSQTKLTLTGLTNGKEYTIVVEVRDTSGEVIVASEPVTGVPGYSYDLFLPMISQ